MAAPEAVLLDVGGIFLLPDRGRVGAALARAECGVDPDHLDAAHYHAAAHFDVNVDVDADWAGAWSGYLDAYVDACGVPDDRRDEAHRHLDSEFADAALWVQPVDGARDSLRLLRDSGVKLGIVSNADGLIAQRLAEREILQVGPGLGVEVECVIDSGNVGVMKPDPRIFEIALEAMNVDASAAWYVGDMPAFDVVGARRAGLRAFILSPAADDHRGDYEVVASLDELARLVAEARAGLACDSRERNTGTPAV